METVNLEKHPLRLLKLMRKKHRALRKEERHREAAQTLTAVIKRKQAKFHAALSAVGVNRQMRRAHQAGATKTQGRTK